MVTRQSNQNPGKGGSKRKSTTTRNSLVNKKEDKKDAEAWKELQRRN